MISDAKGAIIFVEDVERAQEKLDEFERRLMGWCWKNTRSANPLAASAAAAGWAAASNQVTEQAANAQPADGGNTVK
jgi:protein tyrosine phosphatase (PTP) superfamily phosphohydrolase (DUF442 family)